MAIQAAGRPVVQVHRAVVVDAADQPQARSVEPAVEADEALEFVRFCYRRRRVAWPGLYDEMCAVAARGAFKGMGYVDLAEHGVSFCLSEMPRLVELTGRVVAEEHNAHEPAAPIQISLANVPARA